MDRRELNARIKLRGKDFFASISGETPSIFNKGWWTGKVMDWSMRNEQFKVQLFRFVDVLPYLQTTDSLVRHIQEFFASDEQDLPGVLKWGAKGATLGKGLAGKVLARSIRSNIESLAKQFIIGANSEQAIKGVRKLRKSGFAFTLDLLGEATVSEEEAQSYQQSYLDLVAGLGKEAISWPALGGGDLDWGYAPKINLSIKPSALYSQARPVDFEGTVQVICERLQPVLQALQPLGGQLCIDMEQYRFKEITLEVFRRLRSASKFREDPHLLCIVLQSYLRDTDQDLEELLSWAEKNQLPIVIRLVKGAYWDYETILAKQAGWPVPVYTRKPETDAAFERQAAVILKNHQLCYLACGSHNIRSIAAVMELAREYGVPDERYEFQALYGMAEPVRKGLLKVAKRVRLYCPFGELIPGMAYLVRRLLENTANESFLRQGFAEQADQDSLLEDPLYLLQDESLSGDFQRDLATGRGTGFQNHPSIDFSKKEAREQFAAGLQAVRQELGKVYPLEIGGRSIETEARLPSVNPANPDEVVGIVCQAGRQEADLALEAAEQAFATWSELTAEDRASYLFKAAEAARKNIFSLSAWQVLEVGKQWDQAHADVAEAIDFMEYYAREAIRLGRIQKMGRCPGELNHYFYRPKGLALVIAPWNFPLAISCGMSSAALVMGNCVLYKPASLSSVVGHTLFEILDKAGLPSGVFNYLPGPGRELGDYLISHPRIQQIVFTGSMEVGTRIIAQAAQVAPGQEFIRSVVAEMGGKNAIIIDEDADLDQAVVDVLYSAFGFQGQKCSACSRVIVVENIYDRFCKRLVEAARSVKIGPAEDPANYMGPVVDEQAQNKIMNYVALARQEGEILLCLQPPKDLPGYYVPLTIVQHITPEHRLAREEIFGPVLAVMKVKDFAQAVTWANAVPFALTGGVFSRSPKNLALARQAFKTGNLYLNRAITGALVNRQPFGGFKLSGIGSKSGGPDYLLQFVNPVTITENTMRRGFAPVAKDDDWVV